MPWLVGSYFASAVVSQSLMDLISFILLVTFFVILVRAPSEGRWRQTGAEIFLIAWIGVTAFSLWWNSALLPADAGWILKVFSNLKWIFFFYVLVFFFNRMNFSEKALPILFGFLGVIALSAIVISGLGFDPFKGAHAPVTPLSSDWSEGWIRTGGLVSNPMTFAHVFGMMLVFSFPVFLLQWTQQNKNRLMWAVGLILGFTALLLSSTRGAWLGMAGAVCVVSWMFRRRVGIIVVGAGAVGVASLALVWTSFRERLLLSLQWGNAYDSERLWIWRGYWKMWQDHFWFGTSPGIHAELLPSYFQTLGAPDKTLVDHAHNQYLEVAVTLGLFGLLIWLALQLFFLQLTLRVWSRLKNSFDQSLVLGALGTQVFFLIGGFTEANFNHAKVKTVLVVVWALVIRYSYRTTIQPTRLEI